MFSSPTSSSVQEPHGMLELTLDTISSAPSRPGIYAWYADLRIETADLDGGADELLDDGTRDRLRRALKEHSVRYRPAALRTEVRAHFGEVFDGELASRLADAMARRIDPPRDTVDEPEDGRLQSLDRTLAVARTRRALSQLLYAAAPRFSAPIYIGKSHDLRTRLVTHRDQVEVLSQGLSDDPDARSLLIERALTKKSTFAVRAIAQGFHRDQLRVWVLDVGAFLGGDFRDDQLDALAESLEWFLNRWHRPFVGRL